MTPPTASRPPPHRGFRDGEEKTYDRNIQPCCRVDPTALMASPQPTYTDVPARLDRLPWSRFHRLVVVALGITWILDGLEVTLAGSVAAALQTSPRLHLSAEEVGLTGSAYLAGAVLGSLF